MDEFEDTSFEQDKGKEFAEKFFAPPSEPFDIAVGAASHQGKIRHNNEDHFVVVKRRRISEVLLTNLPSDSLTFGEDVAYGLVVADGIGGVGGGEIASRLVIQRMLELAHQATSWLMKVTSFEAQQIRERVKAYVEEMELALRQYVDARPELRKMGTTLTLALLLPPHVLVVHIGDSRAYLLHEGELYQITRDETAAQAYIDCGLDPEEASHFRHVLLNSISADADTIVSQIQVVPIERGDRLLLCTDGLTNMVPDEDIQSIIQQCPDPQEACDQLIDAALAQGGKDNITVALASTS